VRRCGLRADVVPADHAHRDGDEDDADPSLLNRRRYAAIQVGSDKPVMSYILNGPEDNNKKVPGIDLARTNI